MPLLVKSAAQLCRKSVAAALSPDEKKALRSAFEIFLDSERLEETIDALTGLRFVGDDDSARRVILMMNGRDEEEVVQAAIETLLEILNPKYLAVLIGGDDEDLRLAAIRAAGILGLRECVPALIACWESGAPETRLVILEALEQTPDARAAGLLMNAADSGENDSLRNAALRALAKIDTAGAAAFFLEKFRQNDDKLRERLVAALDASDSIEVSDGLVGLLDESSGELQRWALKALAPRRYPPAKPALWRLMRSEDSEIRRAAARAFLHLAGARDAGRLAELLADRDDEIRVETAAVCADIHSPEVIEALRKNALDFNALVAAQSMKALGALGDSDAIPLLEGVLESSERTRVSAAIWAIEEIGGEAALSALGRRRSHPDPRVRAEIARSAARIRFRLLYIE
jgi:HEAT repeat protein